MIKINGLKAARQTAHYTQQQAADLLGYSVDGYSKIERGQRKMSGEFIKRAAEAFGCDPSDILKEISEAEAQAESPLAPIDPEKLASFVTEARDRLASLSLIEAKNLVLALISAARTR